MQKTQRSFAETGAASRFKRRLEKQSRGIIDLPGVEHLGQLTPFQGQVIDAAEAKEAEEKERKQAEIKGKTGGRPNQRRNALAGKQSGESSLGREETVRYVNEDTNSAKLVD